MGVGAGRYRRSGQLCGKCAWVPLRPVNHTLAASKWRVGGRSECGWVCPGTGAPVSCAASAPGCRSGRSTTPSQQVSGGGGEERVRVGVSRYRRTGQLCGKCAWVPLRPVNHTLAASKLKGWGGGGLQVFRQVVSTSLLVSWNKWSCKLYFGGKMLREHFLKKQAMQYISTLFVNNGVTFVPDSKPVLLKPGKSPGFPCRFKNGGL